MASVQSSGLNLNVQSLASQLVAADRGPQDARISRQETRLTVQLSGLSSLKGALSSFESALTPLKTLASFTPHAASVSNEGVFTATADATAAAGNYAIKVIALAKSHQLASAAFLAGNTTVIGTGKLTISQGTSSFDVTIDSTNHTVAGIRDAINKATGNTGVQATLIHETGGTRLVLTANSTGAANAIKVAQTGGDGGLSQLVYDPIGTQNLTQLQPAQDAHIQLAGFDHFDATNTISGAIDGVTLNLKSVTAVGSSESLTVTNDNDKVLSNVQAFVTAFNALQKTFASLRSYNTDTKTTGPLFGDSLLRQVESQVRLDLSNPVSGITGDYNSLASIGVTRQLDGTLAVDTTKLTKAINSGNGAVAQVFGSANGIAARLATHIDAQLATGASFDFRTTSLQSGLKQVANDKTALDARMDVIHARYIKQFSALDALLSNMQQTSSYLAQQLAKAG